MKMACNSINLSTQQTFCKELRPSALNCQWPEQVLEDPSTEIQVSNFDGLLCSQVNFYKGPIGFSGVQSPLLWVLGALEISFEIFDVLFLVKLC